MRPWLASTLLVALVACGGLQRMSDLALDASELQGRFNTPMGLNLTNGWLVISVPEATVTINKVPPAEARDFAKNIAKYAYTHYRHPKEIEQIGVQFVGQRHGRKEVIFQAGSWPISHLFDTIRVEVRPYEDTLIHTRMNNGRTDTVGTMVQSLHRMTAGPYTWWQRDMIFHGTDGSVAIDSLRLDPVTLYPTLETRRNQRGFSRIVYEGRHVHGVLDSGATFTVLDTTFEAAPFASPEIDDVIRAQPLAADFVIRLPTYYPGRIGFVWTSVRVVGVDSSQYIVESTVPAGTVRYSISRSTLALLGVQDMGDPAHRDAFRRPTTKP